MHALGTVYAVIVPDTGVFGCYLNISFPDLSVTIEPRLAVIVVRALP
jgi:hypothetical protein